VPAINGQDILRWTQKILNYEQNPGNGDYGYLSEAYWSLADQPQNGNEEDNNQPRFPAFFSHHEQKEVPDGYALWPSQPTSDQVIAQMSQWPAFINWHHHGDVHVAQIRTGYYNDTRYWRSRLNSLSYLGCLSGEQQCGMECLTNTDKPGFTYAVDCAVADFGCAYEPGIRERCIGCNYILAENGGAGFIGTSRYGLVSTSSGWKNHFLNYIFGNPCNRIGPAKQYMMPIVNDVRHTTNLTMLGSPEQPIWSDTPSRFEVVVDYQYDRIRVLDGISALPIVGAQVCFASRDLSRYYVDVTNAEGYAQIDPSYDFDVTAATDIAVTKKNYIPYQIIGSGPVDRNFFWRGDIAFYGDITVPAGKTLTIKPGTTIKTVGTVLAVNGTLKIEGTSQNRITMTSIEADPHADDWVGISVYTGGTLDMDYCDISYVKWGVEAQAGTTIRANQCDITHFVFFGITINGYCATDPYIGSCRFEYGGEGLHGCDPLAINVCGGNPVIDGNLISGMDGIAFSGDPSDFPIICNNQMAGPGSYGIYVTRNGVELGPRPQIEFNIDSLYNYGIRLSYCYGEGTSVRGNRCARSYIAGLLVDNGSPSIIGGDSYSIFVNKFCDNYGSGVWIGNYSQSEIRSNAIKRNAQYGIRASGLGSAPSFGNAQNPGNNSIGGTIFDAHNSTVNTIMAQGNYWSSGCPPIEIYGSWNVSNCLTSDPHPTEKHGVGQDQLPKEFVLGNGYPNPFNSSISVSIELPREQHVKLMVYNILGQNVRTLANSAFAPGIYNIAWDGRSDAGDEVGSGVYFFVLKSDDYHASNKMALIR